MGLKFRIAKSTVVAVLLPKTRHNSVLRALAWKIILLLQSLYSANLHKSSPCTVCNSSIVEKHSIDDAFLGKSASVPHIAAVGINIYLRCEQEFTIHNEIQNRVE